MNITPKFSFIEFNPRRAQRGVEAVRMDVKYWDGREEWIWMSAKDVKQNVKLFGDCEAFQQALAAYKT